MAVLLLLAALVVVGFALILYRDLFTVVRPNDPKGRPWLTLDERIDPSEQLMAIRASFPDDPMVMHYRFGHDRLAVFDPEAIKCVLNDTSTYGKNLREYRMLKMFIGDGLVTQQGDIHALHRKLINPAFKFSSLKGLVSMFSQTTDNLIARWQTDIKENGGSAEVGVHDGFMKLTLDIIGKAAFGLDFESLTDDTTTLGAQASAVFLNMQETKISPVMRMLFFQYPGVFSNMSRLPVGLGARRQKILAFVDGLVRDVVAAKRKIIAEEGPERDCSAPDLLDLLLAGEGSDQLTDDEIVQHSKTFLFAGHHTTASLLTWVYYCLVDKPEILAKLRREIRTVIGDRKEITNEDLKALTYVNAVIRETLRIYSPVAKVTRSVDKDTSLLGQTVPAGTVLDLCLCATHMDPKYWTDPEAFNPERWMPGGEAQTHSHSYLPFLLGTRNCIGQKFSMMEAKVILAKLLPIFDFTMEESRRLATRRELRVTVKPHPTLMMTVQMAN